MIDVAGVFLGEEVEGRSGRGNRIQIPLQFRNIPFDSDPDPVRFAPLGLPGPAGYSPSFFVSGGKGGKGPHGARWEGCLMLVRVRGTVGGGVGEGGGAAGGGGRWTLGGGGGGDWRTCTVWHLVAWPPRPPASALCMGVGPDADG